MEKLAVKALGYEPWKLAVAYNAYNAAEIGAELPILALPALVAYEGAYKAAAKLEIGGYEAAAAYLN